MRVSLCIKKIIKNLSEESLDSKVAMRVIIENIDFVENYDYSYNNLTMSFNLTYLLYIKIKVHYT